MLGGSDGDVLDAAVDGALGRAGGDGSLGAACIDGLGFAAPWGGLGLVMSGSRGLGLAAAWQSLSLSVSGWWHVDLVISFLHGLVLVALARRRGLGLAGPCLRDLGLVVSS